MDIENWWFPLKPGRNELSKSPQDPSVSGSGEDINHCKNSRVAMKMICLGWSVSTSRLQAEIGEIYVLAQSDRNFDRVIIRGR